MNQRGSFINYDSDEMARIVAHFMADQEVCSAIMIAEKLINDFDQGILEGCPISSSSANQMRLFRFVMPFFDCRRRIDGTAIVPLEVAASLLWFLVWRPLDNILDGDGSRSENCAALLQAFSRAERFQIFHFGLDHALCDLAAQGVSNAMFELDTDGRANPDLIFTRALVQETAFSFFSNTSNETRESYRRYINAYGLLHDAMDIFRDISAGQITPITEIAGSIGGTLHYSPHSMRSFEERLATEVLRQYSLISRVARSKESIVYWNVNGHYKWFTGSDL